MGPPILTWVIAPKFWDALGGRECLWYSRFDGGYTHLYTFLDCNNMILGFLDCDVFPWRRLVKYVCWNALEFHYSTPRLSPLVTSRGRETHHFFLPRFSFMELLLFSSDYNLTQIWIVIIHLCVYTVMILYFFNFDLIWFCISLILTCINKYFFNLIFNLHFIALKIPLEVLKIYKLLYGMMAMTHPHHRGHTYI